MTRGRLVLFSILLAVPFGILEARLFYMQILNAEEYQKQVDWTRQWVEVVPTPRGEIRLRGGEILAAEERCFDVDLVLSDFEMPRKKGKDPELDVKRLEGMLAALAGLLKVEAWVVFEKAGGILEKVEKAIEKRCSVRPMGVREKRNVRRQEWRQPYRLWAGLSFEQVSEVAIDEERYPGLEIRQRTRRTYPGGRLACHVVGFVGGMNQETYDARMKEGVYWREVEGAVSETEYERLVFRGAFFGDRVGKDGIEKTWDYFLTGKRGIERREKNILTKRERTAERHAPEPGRDVVLSIDAALQRRAEELLEGLPGLRGSIVVMDVSNGEVLVLACNPGYDLNLLKPPVSAEVWRSLNDAPDKPLLHRAIAGQFPLGSIFKVVTGAAAIEAGLMLPADVVNCQGQYDPVKWPNKFACWIKAKGGAHGDLNLRDAMARSCNCYFYEAGKRAGIEEIAKMAGLFGLGRDTGIDLPGEAAGLVPTPAWRLKNGGGKWGTANTLNVSIGQGEILVTPLQAARLMAGVATGRLPVPRLNLESVARWDELPLSPATLETVRDGLIAVARETYGTGHAAHLDYFKAAGKTSTAQAGRDLAHHGWFAGYAPWDAPRYAFVVMIEHGGAGSGVPAQTAAKMLSALFPEIKLPDAAPPAHVVEETPEEE